jgi:hypothetical protein
MFKTVLRSQEIFVRLRLQLVVKKFGSDASADHFPHILYFRKNLKILLPFKDIIIKSSVAEPEPVEPHYFAGAGARQKKFRLRCRVCKFIKNVTKTLNFSY